MTTYNIKGDGELDKMLGITPPTTPPFVRPVDSYLQPSGRHTHILTLTGNEIKEKIGKLSKIVVGDRIEIGQAWGDVLPTWARLTDVDVMVTGEPGLVLKMGWNNGFVPAEPLYVDRERATIATSNAPATCVVDLLGDLDTIRGGTSTHSGEHLVATFDGNAVSNRVLGQTSPYFEVVALPAPLASDPPGTANHLRGSLLMKLRMNFIDRSQANVMAPCKCGDVRNVVTGGYNP